MTPGEQAWVAEQFSELQNKVKELAQQNEQLTERVQELEFAVDRIVNPEGCCGP